MFQRDRFHIPNSYLPALLERHMFVGIFKERWDRAYIIYAERCPKNTAIYPQIGPLFDKRCADIKEKLSDSDLPEPSEAQPEQNDPGISGSSCSAGENGSPDGR